MRALKFKKINILLQRKAVSSLQWAWTIVFIIGAALFMQNFLKRSTQGAYQQAGDSIGRQYAEGLTSGHEHSQSNSFSFELNTAGINNSTKVTVTAGKGSTSLQRELAPLDEAWPR